MTKLLILKKELSKIKNNQPSFLGIDGGNIESDIWVCGLEFGSDLKQMEAYYKSYVKTKSIDVYEIPYREKCPDYFIKSKYDRLLSVLSISLFEKEQLAIPVKSELVDDYLKNKLYALDSDIFKLNLYPLAKKDTSWDKRIKNELEVSKEDYYGIYFENRKLFLKELVQKFKPKLIICTSPKYYKDEFIETFYNQNEKSEFQWDYFTTLSGKKFKISVYDKGFSKVLIIPFLGLGNLLAYSEIIDIANYIKSRFKDLFN